MAEEVVSAGSKRKGERLTSKSRKKRPILKSEATPRISNRKPKRCFSVKAKKGDTTEGARKHKFYYYKNSKYTKEELKKRWNKKVVDFNQSFFRTREYSQAAITYYNLRHYEDFVLVKPVMMRAIDVGFWYYVFHVNFKAKKQNEDDRDAVLFFAEVELRETDLRDPPRVVVCTILDATIETQAYCRRCYPGWMVHPVDGLNENCRGPFIEDCETEYYVSSPEELESDTDSASVE